MTALSTRLCGVALSVAALVTPVLAGQASSRQAPVNGSPAAAGVTLPPGYVIGADDILLIVFWREKEMSAEVIVRPDGKISLPLLNDVDAAGYTPDQLRGQIEKTAAKYLAEPNAAVVVRAINSRRAFITGNVMKPGGYPLTADMTVLQLIAIAGGLQEYADSKNIVVMRNEKGVVRHFKVNYKDIVRQKKVDQNILLKPGDTVVVP
jgi:polysaccharide export outer membrane protein